MTDTTVGELAERARDLRRRHRTGAPLVLPNAWDAASARAVVAAGFPVVATGSAAVAAALGYADHQAAPAEEMFAAAARIAAAVDAPVTVDAEAGYGLTPAALVDALLRAGAIGCNLEDTAHGGDGLIDATEQAEYLAGVRVAASETGVDLVVNARVDVWAVAGYEPAERVDEALRRGRAYVEAGADCVYPILADDEHDIARLVDGMDAPVNVLSRPSAPPLSRLVELGVRRVSYGPGLHRLVEDHLAGLLARVAAGTAPW